MSEGKVRPLIAATDQAIREDAARANAELRLDAAIQDSVIDGRLRDLADAVAHLTTQSVDQHEALMHLHDEVAAFAAQAEILSTMVTQLIKRPRDGQ